VHHMDKYLPERDEQNAGGGPDHDNLQFFFAYSLRRRKNQEAHSG